MQRQHNVQGFNKEKMSFVVCGLVCAAGLYCYLASEPVLLADKAALSEQSGPVALHDSSLENPQHESFYVVDGKVTRLIDPRTNQLVNRDRKTPFMPDARFLKARAEGQVATKKAPEGPPPPPPPPPPPAKKEDAADSKKKKREFGPTDAESAVKFMGIVTLGGRTYGMVTPKEGGKPFWVKVGDVIPDCDYTVTKIEKQAISVVDANDRPFLLRDTRYTEDAGASDSTGKDEGDGKGGGKGPDKGGKKPGGPGADKGGGGKGGGGKGGGGKGGGDKGGGGKGGLAAKGGAQPAAFDPNEIQDLQTKLEQARVQLARSTTGGLFEKQLSPQRNNVFNLEKKLQQALQNAPK
ncbi:MAG: hypothetical protein NTW87_35575 [Planctomycetota bacterium]|nr:hypothetical protein [Planctomycetota bacterium]